MASGRGSLTDVRGGESTPSAVVFVDPEAGRIVDAVEPVEPLFGYTTAELVGMALEDLHPTGSDRYRDLLSTLARSESAVFRTFEDGTKPHVRTADGEQIPVEMEWSPARTDGKTRLRVVYRAESVLPTDFERSQYREAVQAAADPIAALDDSHRYLFANPAYCEPLQYDPSEIVGLTITEVLGPDTVAQIEPYLRRGFEGETVHFETARTYPSGRERIYEATYSPVLDVEGSVTGLIGSLNDVTERTRREQELEGLFDGMEDAVFVHPTDGGPFDVVNRTAVRRYGYDEAEFTSMSPQELDVPEEAGEVPERVERILEEGSAVFETTHETKSGETIPVEISSTEITYKGEPAILSIARDISRRKASEQRFEKLFDNASVGIAHVTVEDEQPVVESINPAFGDIFGYDPADVEGVSLDSLFDSPTTAYDRREIYRRITREDQVELEVTRQTPEGTRDFDLRSIPIDAQAGEYFITYTDITDRKERERTLLHQRDELQTLNRLNGLILELIQMLVEAESRDRMMRTACTELATSPLYKFAWIGETHPETEGLLVRASAADSKGTEGREPLARGDRVEAHGPAERALETGEIQVIQNTEADPRFSSREAACTDGEVRSVAAIPLAKNGSVFSVLVICAPREYAFSGRELAGLETLGRILEFATDAIKNRQVLSTDTVVELEFDVTGAELPLVRIAADLGCSIRLEGTVPSRRDGTRTRYLAVEETSTEAFLERAEVEPAVQQVAVLAENPDGRHRIEMVLDHPIYRRLESEHKATLVDLALEAGAGTYVFEVPLSQETRAVTEFLGTMVPEMSFEAKRERDVCPDADVASPARVAEELTDRQFETIQNAVMAGYFEWPRRSTTEDLAEPLGVSPSTVQYHLRAGLRKIVESVFERERRPPDADLEE